MKKSRKTYKKSTLLRLSSESLIVSSIAALSAFIVFLFRGGALSFVTSTAEKIDKFFRKNVAGVIAEKLKLHEKVKMPAKNTVAAVTDKSKIFGFLDKLRKKSLNMPLRSVGVFLITFSVYSAAIFLLKRFYASFGVADINDISASAIVFLCGFLLLCFGEKSVLAALGSGRIGGSLLAGCLGVNESSLVGDETEKKNHVGVMFLLGSLFGVSTLFVSPAAVLLCIFAFLIFVAVMNMPEFGLLLSLLCVSFVKTEYLSILVFVSLISFLIKCIRLKRNMRFGTADVLVLAFLVLLFLCALGNDKNSDFAIITFISVYFLTKNLICSGRLIFQSFNTLCLSAIFGSLLFLLKEFYGFIPIENLDAAFKVLTNNTFKPDMLALLITAMLPISLSATVGCLGKRRAITALILSLICVFFTDSFLFYILVLVAIFVFIAVAFKAPAGALLGSIIVFPPFIILFKDKLAGALTVKENIKVPFTLFGVNASDYGASGTFWSALARYGGIVSVIFFALILLLIFQRVFSVRSETMIKHSSRRCGTVIASAVVLLIDTFVFNPFSDVRAFIFFWFIFGLCGSAYTEFKKPQYYHNTED